MFSEKLFSLITSTFYKLLAVRYKWTYFYWTEWYIWMLQNYVM